MWVAVFVVASVAAPGVVAVAAQEETPTGNETRTPHVDPDATNQNGDLGGIQRALASRMADRLAGSSLQLSQGQYERADELVGEEYQDQYGKYVDVAGETDEDDASETLNTARDQQEDLIESVREYNETRQEYQEAKRNGNEQRARRLARDLEQQSQNVTASATQLQSSYERIGNQTGRNLTDASRAIAEVSTDIEQQQAEIRAAEFQPANLTLTAQAQSASFLNPVSLAGRLTTANGSAIAGARIVVADPERRYVTRTDPDGRFELAFRPVLARLGAQSVTVSYRPNGTSVYLGANATADLLVTQVDSTVTIEDATAEAAFGDAVRVTGRVAAGNRPVPSVPVVVTVGGTRLATGRTTENGSYTLTGELPAPVRAGNRTLRVRLPFEKRSVAADDRGRTLRVRSSPTNLTLSTSASDGGITVSGRLRTGDGEAVVSQPIEVRRNGSTVTVTRTNDDGRYSATIPADPGTQYEVTVAYDEPATNLRASNASTLVAVPPSDGGQGRDGDAGGGDGIVSDLRDWLASNALLAGGLLVGCVLAGLAIGRALAESSDMSTGTAPTPGRPAEPESDEPEGATTPLAAARGALGENTNAAVERAYAAARSRLQADGIATSDATHWEFYRACLEAGIDRSEALETLTGLYERAAFDPRDVSESDAETAVERADEIL